MIKDIKGHRFGRLVALAVSESAFHGPARWMCACDCGKSAVVRGDCLRNGNTTSCGCFAAECAKRVATKHGFYGTRTYAVWSGMRQRCTNKNQTSYIFYGSRGISVCERWQSFEAFVADMGECQPGKSLDRINNNGNYCKENCRWANQTEQSNNTRANRMVSAFGETKTMAEWARDQRCEVKYHTLKSRLNRGSVPCVAMRRQMEVVA